MTKHAVIDLGTNTFHLLVVELDADGREAGLRYCASRFVKLAEAGIQRIGAAAFERGLATLALFRHTSTNTA
ncbi:MAG: hypothetical protein IPM98_14020 [Lewinellaceae bacterium]|nr:hypothetical protein [Lewinellaceae bacterium]